MSCASVPGIPNSIGIQMTCASWTVVIVELKALIVDEETTKIPTAGTFPAYHRITVCGSNHPSATRILSSCLAYDSDERALTNNKDKSFVLVAAAATSLVIHQDSPFGEPFAHQQAFVGQYTYLKDLLTVKGVLVLLSLRP
jgi:hypothetical protein